LAKTGPGATTGLGGSIEIATDLTDGSGLTIVVVVPLMVLGMKAEGWRRTWCCWLASLCLPAAEEEEVETGRVDVEGATDETPLPPLNRVRGLMDTGLGTSATICFSTCSREITFNGKSSPPPLVAPRGGLESIVVESAVDVET
jgi:hypothetical protein